VGGGLPKRVRVPAPTYIIIMLSVLSTSCSSASQRSLQRQESASL